MDRDFLNEVKFKSVKIKKPENTDQKVSQIPLLLKRIICWIYAIGLIVALMLGGKYGFECLICEIRDTPHMSLYELWQDFQLHRGE